MMKKFILLFVILVSTIIAVQIANHRDFYFLHKAIENYIFPQIQFDFYVKNISPKTSIVHKQFNFHIAAKGVWRSSQPNKESLSRMKEHGLKSVINLRSNEITHRWEKKLANKLELNYYHFPMDARAKQYENILKKILIIMHDPIKQPLLIHCLSGKDRTGLLVALYRLRYDLATLDEVHQEMLMYGYDEKKYPKIIETIKEWSQKVK